jgi:hypothetical protein
MANKSGRATQFGVCIDNAGYPASLEVGKLYPVMPDPQSARHGYLRVIDESGEDYGYSAKRLFLLDVPEALGKALSPRRSPVVKRPRRALQPTARKARR